MVSYPDNRVPSGEAPICLNPCCNGRWSRTGCRSSGRQTGIVSLNPCCNGRWSRTVESVSIKGIEFIEFKVLILVVMEDGLVQCMTGANSLGRKGLNPYCSGQWSRTRLNLRLLLALQS